MERRRPKYLKFIQLVPVFPLPPLGLAPLDFVLHHGLLEVGSVSGVAAEEIPRLSVLED